MLDERHMILNNIFNKLTKQINIINKTNFNKKRCNQ